MGKDEILKTLEREKCQIDKQEDIRLSGMIAIMEALIYIISMLDRETDIGKQVAAVEAEASDKKPKKEPKRKVIDYGKVNALYNAGWSQQKIADEIGVCQNTVSHALRKYTTYIAGGYIWDAEDKKFIKK